MTSAESRQRPYKVWSCDRQTRKAVMASNLRELRERGSSRLGFPATDVKIVLESDGTEVEDDIYFQTIDRDTIFLILCPGERWLPPGVEALRAALIDAVDQSQVFESAEIFQAVKRGDHIY